MNATCADGIAANPDVSGLGIRASLYALCLSGRVLNFFVQLLAPSDHSADFVRSTTSALSIQGLSLLCTAIVQTIQGQLTLFHAIVVLHLLALLGINLASRGRYSGNDLARYIVDAILIAVAVIAFVALHIYVWINARDFGPQPECNPDTVYVIFGVSVHATNDIFRYIILATFAVVPAGFILVLILGLPCWVAACCFGHRDRRGAQGGRGRRRDRCRNCCSIKTTRNTSPGAGGPPSVASSTSKANKLITDGLQAMGYTAFSIYAIVSLEQMIARNNVSDEESEWTFGQIIAIFLLLGTLYELVGVVISSVGSRSSSSAVGGQVVVRAGAGSDSDTI